MTIETASELCNPISNTDLDIRDIEYDPTGKPNSQRAVDRAIQESLTIIFPADDELQIDIDNEHSYTLYLKQRDILVKHIGIANERETPSKTGFPHRHITIKLNSPITEIERLALQASLGSDRVRELLGYVQYKNNDPHPTLFLEKPAT